VTSGVRGRRGSRDEGVRLVRSDVLVDFRTYDFSMKAGDGEDQATEEGEPESDRVVFHITTRCCERRLPGLGLTRFRVLGASVEAQLEPLYAGGVDARAFANAVIAAAIVEPTVSASDVEGWSEQTRAIARVATVEVLDCRVAYERLAGKGMTGDERLREAMRERRDELQASLRASSAALRAAMASNFALPKMLHSKVIDMTLRRQRQMERLFRPAYFEQMERTRKQVDQLLRPSYFGQIEKLRRQLELPAAMPHGVFGQLGHIDKLVKSWLPDRSIASLFTKSTLGSHIARNNAALFGSNAASAVLRNYARLGDDLSGQVRGLGPSYFGALQLSRLVGPPAHVTAIRRLAEQAQQQLRLSGFAQASRVAEQMRQALGLDRVREGLGGFLERYQAWLEREWAQEKERSRPRPLLFLLASLPALVGLQLLRELERDDELLLTSLEGALGGSLVEELQEAVQREGTLDSVAKQHLVQALTWVGSRRYVDAAPPLYQGLERAFKLVARERRIVDQKNIFLIPNPHQRKATKIEDLFRYLDLDPRYERFLNTWVFGEMGTLARHGDLAEDEHRRWVLRTVLAVVGWLEYLGGRADAVAELVGRLELEPGDDTQTGDAAAG
jgi:hypothetical protein